MTHLGIRSRVVTKVQKVQQKCKKAQRVRCGGNRLCTLFLYIELCLLGCKIYVYYLVARLELSFGGSTVCTATTVPSVLCATVPSSSI